MKWPIQISFSFFNKFIIILVLKIVSHCSHGLDQEQDLNLCSV